MPHRGSRVAVYTQIMNPSGGKSSVRTPAVAGYFYPADAVVLRAELNGLMRLAKPTAIEPLALVAPHAGYVYSGPIAASAYTTLTAIADRIRRVVVAGPSHRVPFTGIALSGASAYETPLGQVPLDDAATRQLSELDCVNVLDIAHASEHSIEVQIPFLQTVLDDFLLVPLVVGEANPEEVATVFEMLGGPDTLFVISTDLSHYNDYNTARTIDHETATAIESLQHESIGPENACGCRPLNGLLSYAHRHDLQPTRLDLRNSGDTAGDRRSVVGYAAYAFC